MSSTDRVGPAFDALLGAIEAQPEFAEQQSRRGGKVYFMWDFVGNTKRMWAAGPAARSEVTQRSAFADVLFNDATGKLSMMTGGDNAQFSPAVKTKSAELVSALDG